MQHKHNYPKILNQKIAFAKTRLFKLIMCSWPKTRLTQNSFVKTCFSVNYGNRIIVRIEICFRKHNGWSLIWNWNEEREPKIMRYYFLDILRFGIKIDKQGISSRKHNHLVEKLKEMIAIKHKAWYGVNQKRWNLCRKSATVNNHFSPFVPRHPPETERGET